MKKLLSIKNKEQERIDDENAKLRAELEYWKAKYVADITGAGKSNSTKQRNPWLDNIVSLLYSKPDYVKYFVAFFFRRSIRGLFFCRSICPLYLCRFSKPF